ADLADGLEIDIDTFAEAMDVDPDELAEQLELIEDQVNGLDAGILPLLFWDPDLGQPQSLRQVFVDLPAAGEDPALDLLLQELDAWLLPMLLDGSLADADLTAAQAAQLAEFGLLIGSDQATVIRSEREQYRDNGETEYRTVEVTYTVAELGGEALQDFVAQAFAEDLALQRLPSVPSFGQLVGILARLTKEEIDRLFSELRYVGDERDDRMVEAFRRNNPGLDVEAILAEFGELTWLPAVLAGRALPPTDPASQELLIGFVQAVGLVPRAVTFDQALKILRGERILQGEVVLGNPTGGIILFDDVALDGIDDVATRAGILTDGDVDAVNAFAEALLASGTGEFDRFATLSDAELGGEPLEFSQEIFIQLLASTVDLDLLTENQLIAALVYIDGATTAGDQARRIANAVIGFQTTAAIGPPTLTEGQYRQVLGNDTWNYLNSRARSERGRRYKDGDDWLTDHSNSKTNLELQNEQTRFIFEHIGVPGYHKKKFRRRRLHLAVDGNGDTAAFVVEKIPKKSWVGTAFTLVFAIGAAFSGNVYASYALAATQFARAALDGDWLGAFAAAASTILLVDGLGQVAGNLGVSTAIAGSSVAGFQTAIEVAKTVSIGIGLATSIADNDTVGIIVNSTRALASGAEVFDYADTADNLATVATLIESVDTAVEAIENDDILLAAAASAGAVAAGAKLGSSSNLFGPETTELLEDVSETFDATGRTIGGVDRTIDAIEDDDIVGAAVGILQTGSAATDLASDGLVGDRVFGLGEDGVAFGDKVAEALDTAATTTQTVDVAVQAFEDGDISAGITAVGQAIAAGASVFQAGGLGADLLGLDEDAILAVEAIITTAEDVAAGAEVASAIERDDVFAAIEILTARIAENQGPDDSLVGHYADQLSKLTALAETLTRIDDLDQTAFFEALIPDLNALGTALESRDEPLPLFADTAQFQAVDALIDTIDQALFPPEPAPAPIFVANPDIGPDQQVILAASTNENGEIVVTELPAFPITTVEPGQTLTEIARYYGVDVDELIALNPQLEDPDLIQPGDPLRLPDDATPTFHPSPARPAIDPTTGEPIGPLVVVTAEELAAVLGTTANLLLAQDPTLADPSLDAIDRVS
ncbi:MAG: LysM peptidoglycan-binding domain-containing protein, partial [Actinomycetota bacterium]